MSNGAELPDDVETLRALLSEARAQLAERDLEIEHLKVQIDKLKRMQFGRKSEQLDREAARLETQLDDVTGGRGVADVRRARQSSARTPVSDASPKEALPPHLSREERVLDADATCPKCGSAMQPLGEDVSEQLARVAAVFKVIRTIRRKTVCPCGHHVSQSPMLGLPITRSIAHPSLLADILVSKYADHTPLYRQSQIAARDGVKLDPASMGRWVGQCEALTEALRRYTMAPSKLHTDDTPIPVLAPGNKKTKTGRLWVYMRDVCDS
ncbi:zinc-finger binding domain of transposase IS66 family protein [Burkholderia humptydooensis]|nr:zinc-finger binding domain of transposase IS66 family protein [Burkholderia sp. 2002721687]